MTEGTFAVLALLVLAWAVMSDLLARVNINGPLVFLVAGCILGNPDWGPLSVDVEASSIHLLAEVTLALLLFADASRVNVAEAQTRRPIPRTAPRDRPSTLGRPGLPPGGLALHDLTWALAGFVGATLAPTDAALSAQVINDSRIPMRVRRVLNVESGLNDGIVTPVVAFMLAVAAGQLGIAGDEHAGGGGALLELAVGVAVGLAIGWGSGLSSRSGRDGTGSPSVGGAWAPLPQRSAASVAVALDANGFIAAFVAGIAFGAGLDDEVMDVEKADELPELLGEVLALAVWFAFGAALVPVAFHHFDLAMLLYALLSLTAVRLGPVALSLLGSGLDRRTVLFVGWFGPRGLASVVFALLAIEELGETAVVAKPSARSPSPCCSAWCSMASRRVPSAAATPASSSGRKTRATPHDHGGPGSPAVLGSTAAATAVTSSS